MPIFSLDKSIFLPYNRNIAMMRSKKLYCLRETALVV